MNDPGVVLPTKYVQSTANKAKVLKDAKEPWVTLCKTLGFPEAEWKDKTGKGWDSWDNIPDIMKAIEWLKCLRIPIAHPIF